MNQEIILIKDLDSNQLVDFKDIQNIQSLSLKSDQWALFWNQLYESHKQLCTASQNNDIEQLNKLLSPQYELPIDINMKLEEQWSCLHYAAIEGNLEAIILLLKYGAKPDSINNQQRTPLHIASIKGYFEICEVLIKCHANIDLRDYQQNTPLHLASQLGYGNIVKLLLEQGADYKIRNNFNRNAYDLSFDEGIAQIFEQICNISDYQRKSFSTMTNNRNEHIMKLLALNQKPQLTKPQVKVSQIRIQNIGPQDFQVLTQLGKGSFGQVYLVKQKLTNKLFAMKILNKAKIISQNITKYIQTEKRVLSIIDSPFIVKLHYAFQTENKLYMILDYCPGGDLEQLMNIKGALPEKIAITYAVEILLALESLHQSCIIYRDLKPSNVVIDSEGHACLTDFGLSKELRTQRTTSYCGSHAYLAPEMLDKLGHGFPLDWYLYGVFVYELVAGKPPYYDRERSALYSNIRYGKLYRPQNISDQLWDLLTRLLERNPSRRLGSVSDAEEIKQHKWFKDIDFNLALQRKLPVPKIEMKNQDDDLNLKVTFSEQAQYNENDANFIQDWTFTS